MLIILEYKPEELKNPYIVQNLSISWKWPKYMSKL